MAVFTKLSRRNWDAIREEFYLCHSQQKEEMLVQTLLTLLITTITKLPNQRQVHFVVNALPVSNVCAHVATKVLVLAYCRTKLICILLP